MSTKKSSKPATKSTTQRKTVTKELALVDNHSLVQFDETDQMQYIPIKVDLKPVGGENDEDEQIFIPKIKILGSNSDEVKKKSGAYVEDAEEGQFFHTLTKECFEELNIVPLTSFTERYYSGGVKMSKDQICTSRDGRGKFGLCFSGDYKKHGIPNIKVEIEGVFQEVGNCATCPHSQRLRGQQSECQMVKYMICAHKSFIEEWQEQAPLLAEGNPQILLRILQNLFILPFKSTSLKAFSEIKRVITFSGAYFDQTFKLTTFLDHNDQFEWHNYVVQIDRMLTQDERIFAYSIMRLAKSLRRVLRDEDIEILSGPKVNVENGSGKESELEDMESK